MNIQAVLLKLLVETFQLEESQIANFFNMFHISQICMQIALIRPVIRDSEVRLNRLQDTRCA